ncbi:NAD-dependent epimerase/dehydratase family protein [Rhizosphaericola mali]|uniref:NAD(P)-dependent oxidoreductase n=1 Tax=Rhizosphaericola mali TaxID=2545455 RepID=A0A5P2G5T5_9BACT|nr:NAD(P)-dependent oxidoreductase [Rhizosphaericola mali]QES89202.1 NAD(P)-dependent oxidoreductase [Rhizosphaericola mali]
MEKVKILLTGGTGFLGSAILLNLKNIENVSILAVKRKHSNISRFKDIQEIQWIDLDEEGRHIEKWVDFKPTIIIHSAWAGVTSGERELWNVQLQNFELFRNLTNLAEIVKIDKFIALGSQSEYGNYTTSVTENADVVSHDAYASCKIAMKSLLETFCTRKNIDWYWLRVFSVYGPGENENWFIPWIISKQLRNEDVALTGCEQAYDYLYIDDFAKMIEHIVFSKNKNQGVYNICSGYSLPLKEIALKIREIIGTNAKLNFGAIPYRENQSMFLGGNNLKFKRVFGVIPNLPLELGLEKTINYYRTRLL